jgi:hypothetical protein
MDQHLYRDFNVEDNSSVNTRRNEIQLAMRKTRWASTCTEISTLNTTAVSRIQEEDTEENQVASYPAPKWKFHC